MIFKIGVQIFCTITKFRYQKQILFVAEFEWMETNRSAYYYLRFVDASFKSWKLSSFRVRSLLNVWHILFDVLTYRASRQGLISYFTSLYEPLCFQEIFAAMTCIHRTILSFEKLASSVSFGIYPPPNKKGVNKLKSKEIFCFWIRYHEGQ